ncbi:hypothetical protein [Nitrosospira sp. NRS527]|nr:hypothetical protein [Nitrosospira sp. NRS527]BCT67722.1 hypothetical protein NNRS527_01310 [Nitrosospira sp. NRS527]
MREFRLDMDRSNWTVRYRWFILAGGEKQQYLMRTQRLKSIVARQHE